MRGREYEVTDALMPPSSILQCQSAHVYVGLQLSVLTTGEDERTRVLVHWEIMELQLTFSVDGHPKETDRDKRKDT